MSQVVQTSRGSITVTDGAVAQIVLQATESVDGVRVRRRPRRKLTVDLDLGRVDLGLTVAYGRILPEVARDVQSRVTDALTRMCDVEIGGVDVTVEELDRG